MSDRKRNVPKKTISPIAVKNEIFRRFLLSLKLNMTTTSIYSVFLQAHYISFNRLAPVSSSNLILTSRKKLQHCDSGQKIGIICENFFFFFFFQPFELDPGGSWNNRPGGSLLHLHDACYRSTHVSSHRRNVNTAHVRCSLVVQSLPS